MPTIATGTGAEVYARRLAKGLLAKGHSVNLDIVPHRYQYFPWLAPIGPRDGTDLTIANSWSAAAFAGPAPLVTIIHHVVHDPVLKHHKTGAQAFFHRFLVKPMEQAAVNRSAAVIAVSQTTAINIHKYLSDVEVQTVLNGIDTKFFTPGELPKCHDAERPIELLFVGKPSRRKAFDTVAEIVEQLGEKCRFTCIGPAPEPGVILPSGIFRGQVSNEELRAAYRCADYLLMPSRLEGFGYAAAEAMACGLPVICTAGGAVAEIVGAPDCGIAVKRCEAGLFVQALLEAWSDAPGHASMRANARRRAVERLDELAWIDGVEEILREVARSGRATTRPH